MKNLKVLFVVAGVVSISACTTFEDIQNGLGDLSNRGAHVNELIAKIGYPNGQTNVAGQKLYIWDSSRTVSYTMPVTSYNSGTVSTYGTYGSTFGTYGGTSTSYVPQTANYRCKITVEVDSSERIRGYGYDGNIGGCQRYASALKTTTSKTYTKKSREYNKTTGDKSVSEWSHGSIEHN